MVNGDTAVVKRLPGQAGPALAAAVTAIAIGFLVSVDVGASLAIAAGAAAIPAYRLVADRAGVVLATLLPLLLAALLLPRGASLLVQITLALCAVVWSARAALQGRRTGIAALAVLGIVAFWLLLTLNPNVPSAEIGFLGVRKTSFFLVGLPIGLLWPIGSTRSAELLLVRMLWAVGVAILVAHTILPGLEDSLFRAANPYTEELAGVARTAGFFASPFTVSLLGTFLTLWAWHAFLTKAEDRAWLPPAYALTGILLVSAAGVRTGYLVVGAGLALTPLLRPGRQSRLVTLLATTATVALGVLLLTTLPSDDRAIESIPQLGSDTRVASRLATFERADDLFRESPWIGWGAGSAGSTLANDFRLKRHVTSHNMLVGMLVEGGLLALCVIVAAFAILVSLIRNWWSPTHPAAAAILALLGFALAINVSEALPVSFFLMALIGLRGRAGDEPDER